MTRRTAVASVLALAVAGAVGVAVWLAADGSTTPSSRFPVPARVRRTIARSYRPFAYLPKRVPSGLQYTSYSGIHGFEFTISFDGTRAPSLQYEATLAGCSGQPMQSFIVNGIDVAWTGTYTDQRAWRCIAHDGSSVVVSASRSVVGDANPAAGNGLTAKQRRDALQLAQVVASARPAASP